MKFPNLVVFAVIKIEVGPSLPIMTAEPKSFPKIYEGTNNAGAKIKVRIAIKSKAIIAFFNVKTPMLTQSSGAACSSPSPEATGSALNSSCLHLLLKNAERIHHKKS